MPKRNLKISLIVVDIVVLLIIFVTVLLLFELVIKKMLINYSVDKFYESIRTTQFDLSNSMTYIEEKEELLYEKFVKEIFSYLKVSTLQRAKYDNSIVMFIFPEEDDYFISGIRNSPDTQLDKKSLNYEEFKNKIEEVNKSRRNPNQKDYVVFNIKGNKYIGIAEYTDTGIRKSFDRNNNDVFYPIIVIADRGNEFFFLINRIEALFFILFSVIFGVGAIFKFYNTMVATNEIYTIKDNMQKINNDIKLEGQLSTELSSLNTRFIETTSLDESFLNMVSSLKNLGNIISGIADTDLLIATLKNDNSLLNPHYEMMTIMFLDIQGFTSITEKHKDNIIEIINHIWTEVENVVGNYNGKINKLIGDAALIIFRDNDIEENQTSSENAFYSTIKLLEKVSQICIDLDIDFNFRVGLDYGKITYGKTGTDKNYELGVIGDTVNTASRLEALSKQYHTNFLITENVYNNIKFNADEEYNFQNYLDYDNKFFGMLFKVDKARPKGKKEAKEIFTLLVKNDDKFKFIGNSKLYQNEDFNIFSKLHKEFVDSIKHWQEYHKSKGDLDSREMTLETLELKQEAEKCWADIAKEFAVFHIKSGFPPAEHFAKTILRVEEYEEFVKYTDSWIKKGHYRVKEPGIDWIELGTVELSK